MQACQQYIGANNGMTELTSQMSHVRRRRIGGQAGQEEIQEGNSHDHVAPGQRGALGRRRPHRQQVAHERGGLHQKGMSHGINSACAPMLLRRDQVWIHHTRRRQINAAKSKRRTCLKSR